MPDDHAILVGIARYQDAEHYPPLGGPLNDVDNIYRWLRSPGYDLPEANIQRLVTDQSLIEPEPGAMLSWQPSTSQFADTFKRVTYEGPMIRRRDGRLYLYFSGHGFSMLGDKTTRAALYGADCSSDYPGNLPGSLYAEAAKRTGMFREIVLFMDCCRDAVSEMEYALPQITSTEVEDAESVKVLAIYAAPKRGKAHERELPDTKGRVVGLATHAWLRALQETPCDILGQVAASQLKQFMINAWNQWYPTGSAPSPRFVMPEEEDLLFQSNRPLVNQMFRLGEQWVAGDRFRLRAELQCIMGTVDDHGIKWDDQILIRAYRSDWSGTAGAERQFELRLSASAYTLMFEGGTLDFTPGAQHVIEI
ncbi:caspase family protein [Pseudomonas mosselii]|uniref:caspase family protein n=1 Tax=Pseudomonas mosselii TaxID=78327 RepID=UPI0015E8E0FA|nr:caspase family protein [Pseudomonas mosselii]